MGLKARSMFLPYGPDGGTIGLVYISRFIYVFSKGAFFFDAFSEAALCEDDLNTLALNNGCNGVAHVVAMSSARRVYIPSGAPGSTALNAISLTQDTNTFYHGIFFVKTY